VSTAAITHMLDSFFPVVYFGGGNCTAAMYKAKSIVIIFSITKRYEFIRHS